MSGRIHPDYYWPKRYDFPDHVSWIKEKQPQFTEAECIEWAQGQMRHQIVISEGSIRGWEAQIREERTHIKRMEATLAENS